MIDPRDMEHCKAAIKVGSLSFHSASKLLPSKVRDPALALYAFCRLADDAVDENDEKAHAVLTLRDRLDLVYQGQPRNAPADRAFAAVVEDFDMPRTLPDALLEGLAWDAVGRQYRTFSELLDYCARVASAVGAMMSVLMRVRDADALARACDLGLAMQLTNIARDVGEDARARRLYLPLDWMEDAGIDPETFFADPLPDASIRAMVRKLLREADKFYYRSESGVTALPMSCRPGIYAARHIYAGIGGAIRRNGYDTISWRGRTSKGQKIGWLGLSLLRSAISAGMPQSAVLHGAPAPEVAFLVDAAAKAQIRPRNDWGQGRAGALLAVFAQLEAQDRAAARIDHPAE